MGQVTRKPRDSGTTGVIFMMAFMMIGLLLLFLAVPLVGWPIGLGIVAVGAVAMLFFHQRFMRR